MAKEIPISSSMQQVNPSLLFDDGFELQNNSVIPSSNFSGSFTEGVNNIEFYIYNAQKNIQYSNYNFSDYQITANSLPAGTPPVGQTQQQALTGSYTTNEVSINPESDIYNAGYGNGTLYGVYNFVNYQLNSNAFGNGDQYYLSEISGDRTEIRIKSNYISNDQIQLSYIQFEQTIVSTDFFDEFYISFGENEYHIGINSQLEFGKGQPSDEDYIQSSVLIKLYDALPPNYQIGDELYVVTKTAETQVFEVEFEADLSVIDDTISLKGPNTNLSIKDFINNSTTYKNKQELLGTNSTGSKDQFINVLNRKGITLTPNYSTSSFGEFVNFSSAKQRTQNFYEKLSRIQTYENDINNINPITSSNDTSEVSSSIASLYTKIENEIKNFDGWDYYLYYNTSSDSYPKDTSDGQIYPYRLLNTGSATALRWLGSDVENDQYYGGTLFSASRYDDNNQNWLYYTIPTFITEQSNNDNYVEFCNMVGQSFDELWLYTKTITAKLNTTNVLDEGVPLSLADDVITSLGYTGFGNNYNNQDNFIGMVGNDDGTFVPPTGSELILNYIAINKGQIINYWDPEYTFEGYVEQLITKGFPYPIDAVSKEIFKRLYHNMSSLVKRKGTVSGLRQLINIWGIPNTILRINEFGGKNKDQTDDYDLWYERYSYAFTPVANSYRASASAIVPWMPLERNYIADSNAYIVPDGVAFRFKTTGYPSSSFAGSFNSQSLAVKKSNGLDDDEFDWGIMLNYTGSTSGSYRGAGNSDYRDWAEMKFYISGAASDGGNIISDPIYLPFFDGGWWSVLLQRDSHLPYTNNTTRTTYTLYAKNKIYNGNDGNSLGFEGSSSIINFDTSSGGVYGTDEYGTALYGAYISSSINYAWNKFGVKPVDGVYIGGRIKGSKVGTTLVTNIPGQAFSGSFQEFRYYSNDISESVFNDFVMNPESIEGNNITGSESSFDVVNFRAPLGNELENFFTSSDQVTQSAYIEHLSSSHPAITGSSDLLITGSFINPADNSITSSYNITYEENSQRRTFSKTNVETYFLDQPAIGFRNRISNKIQNTQDLNFGNTLSGLVSIEKDPFISQSYTENLNQLEVAFSPQDEINDDIIQSLGFGAIQEVLADPRFRSSTSDYYPQLRKIADDYFKKYQGGNVYDYLRLIKFFDDSLFKAIKNYVPARTSVSTGIVIHQNMLERNRYREPKMDIVTTQSYAITNIPLTAKNLELTGSIEMFEFTGSTGGSLNKYNITSSQSGYYGFTTDDPMNITPESYININSQTSNFINLIPGFNPPELVGDIYGEINNDFSDGSGNDFNKIPYLKSKKAIQTHFSIYAKTSNITNTDIIISSSLRGELFHNEGTNLFNGVNFITPPIDIIPEETIAFYAYNPNISTGTAVITEFTAKTYDPQSPPSSFITLAEVPDISSSYDPSPQEYIEFNQTPVGFLGKPANQQYEFYDGEFSGSTFSTHLPYSSSYVNPYNPYLRVSKYSIANDRTANLPTSTFAGGTSQNFRLIKNRNMSSSITNSPNTSQSGMFNNIPVQIITSTSGFGTILATVQVDSGAILSFKITNNLAINLEIGDTLQVSSGAFSGLTSVINLTIQAGDIGSFGLLAPTTATVDNSGNDFFAFYTNVPTNLLNNRKYMLSFMISSYTGTAGSRIGLSNVNSTGDVNLFTQGAAAANSNGPFSSSFETAFIPNGSNTLAGRISISPGFKGVISQFNIAPNYAEDSRWNEIAANIYLNPLQQDQWQIQNTQSIIFANSEYNPLNNNVNLNRSSSTRILLSYNDEQYQPENFQQIITYSLDNTSQSLFADIPDSNYTQLASINPRYNGSTLQSLNYNFFTTSGSVGMIRALPTSRYNKKAPGYSSSVADTFLNGTSQSQVTGKNSWTGDVSYGKTAVIDKHPKYIAHFKSSFEQYNYWDSYQYNIDSLIEIPSESIANRQFTPTSQLVDGSNEYKKVVSSAFEPGRKMAVSYDSIKTFKQDLSTLPIGNYDIGGGSIEFLTINGNEQTRITNALSWSYNYKGKVTGSKQEAFETQLQTGSISFDTGGEDAKPQLPIKGFILQGAQNANIVFNQGVGGVIGKSTPVSLNGYLQVQGPQLALYHTYNTAVAKEQHAPEPVCVTNPPVNLYKLASRASWCNQGIPPSNPDSYYQWAASASQCTAYSNNQEPFLIQRGDIIRAEGQKLVNGTPLTSSINFIEDFTVMSIEDYHYSGSYELAQLLTGNNFDAPGPPPNGGGGGRLKNASGVFIDTLGLTGTNVGSVQLDLGNTGGGKVQVQVHLVGASKEVTACFIADGGNTNNKNANYAVGQTYTVNPSTLGVSPFNVVIQVGNMKNITDMSTGASILISNTGSDNFFSISDTDNCGSGFASSHPLGQYTVKYPTFLATDRNPEEVLMGLNKGQVQRFTIRRQTENDSSVMGYNIYPPSLVNNDIFERKTGQLKNSSTFSNVTQVQKNVAGATAGDYPILGTYTSGTGAGGSITITVNTFGNINQVKTTLTTEDTSFNYVAGETVTIPGSVFGGSGTLNFTVFDDNLVDDASIEFGGAAAPTGEGFLIPKDLSEVQKANALDIINQERSKNAFPPNTQAQTR